MNASQRRIAHRAMTRAFATVGILPGNILERKAPKKAALTSAEFIGIDPKNPRHSVVVRRRDNRTASWPFRETLADGIRLPILARMGLPS